MIYKVLVNTITFTRVILSLILAYELVNRQSGVFMDVFIILLIYTTDFLDGRVARKFSACSNPGAVFDVLADLLFLLASGIALTATGTYPVWMLAIILGKFLEFWCTSAYMKKNSRYHNKTFLFDQLGRKVVVLIYVLPGISVLLKSFVIHGWILPIMNQLCIPIALGAVISSIQRIITCMRIKDSVYT